MQLGQNMDERLDKTSIFNYNFDKILQVDRRKFPLFSMLLISTSSVFTQIKSSSA